MSKNIRILIVEDSVDDVALIIHRLRKNNFDPNYIIVDSAETLKQELYQKEWDIIFSDYSMVGFNGFEALKIVREYDENIPFLLISGSIGEELAVQAMIMGANDYILKDNMSRFVPSVRQALKRYEEYRKRRVAEEEARRANKEWQDIFQAIGQSVVILDKEFKILSANKFTTSLTGLSEEDLKDKSCHDIFHSNGRPENCPMLQVLKSGKPEVEEMETNFGDFLLSCTPIFNDAGEIEKIIHVATDISELKAKTIESSSLRDQLVRAQRMEAVGRLAGGIAHDFNNVLTVIQGNVQLAQMKAELNAELKVYLEQIFTAGERAVKLTRQLLAFSRKQAMKMRVVNLNDIITGMGKMLERLIGEDIKIDYLLNSELANILGDEGNLEQVIMNLAINARDAMPRGGTLIISTRNVSLTEGDSNLIEDYIPGDYVRLSIKDSGTGMTEDVIRQIFEPFFTTKEKGKGTGLGLSVVYGIIKQHNGYITLDSKLNAGTEFQVFFPISKESQAVSIGQEQDRIQYSGEGKQVLLVEDEENIRQLFTRALDKYGFKVTTAASAEDALVEFSLLNGKVDIVISDMVMPGKSGLELAEELRIRKPGLKIILTSGYLDDKIKISEIQGKGFKFLQKPYSLLNLLDAVRDTLSE